MARKIVQLSDKDIINAPSIKLKKLQKDGFTGNSIEKQFTLFDGDGLFLLILPDKIIDKEGKKKKIPGSKLWRFKYRLNNKEKVLALGSYPELTLKKAREKRTDLREQVEAGIDPAAEKQLAKKISAKKNADPDSFENVAIEWHKKPKKKPWKLEYSEIIMSRLIKNVFPHIGHIPISKIEPPQLVKVLYAIEDRNAPVLAHKIQGYLTKICKYAVRAGIIKYNPAADLAGTIEPAPAKNYPALTEPADVASYLQKMNDPAFIKCRRHTQQLLLLHPMLFLRPGSLRLLEWSEINYEDKLLDLPAEKMKMEKSHFVPLSRQAIDILNSLKARAGSSPYVFAHKTNSLKPINARTASVALARMGFSGELTPHGFRATGRTMCRERLHVDIEYLEIQLAHKTKSPNGTAYDRVAFLEERHKFMQAWSDYLDDLRNEQKPKKHWTRYLPPEELED